MLLGDATAMKRASDKAREIEAAWVAREAHRLDEPMLDEPKSRGGNRLQGDKGTGTAPGTALDGLEARYQPAMKCFRDIEPEEVEWLWRGRIPLSKMTMLVGDPGVGKSFVTIDLAARVSKGERFPDGADNKPGGVVFLSAEDDPGDTIRPRLDRHGADVSRIHVVTATLIHEERDIVVEDWVRLDRDICVIKQAVKKTEARLIIIDPLTAYLGDKDSHKNAELRGLLGPLAAMAAECRVAVVCVSHLNKKEGPSALHRSIGSIAFQATARAGWVIGRDPDDEEGTRRVMLPTKMNLCKEAPGIAFRIIDGRVVWDTEPVRCTESDVLSARPGSEGQSAVSDASEFLKEILAAGPVPVKQIRRESKDFDVSDRTLDRAKARLGVVSNREGYGKGSRCVWQLNSDPYSAKKPIGRQLPYSGGVGAVGDVCDGDASFPHGHNARDGGGQTP